MSTEAEQRVADLFDESVGAVEDDVSGGHSLAQFALALALTNQPERMAAVPAEGPWKWLTPARLIAAGRHAEGADELAAIGARPEEALARLLAARALIVLGDRAGGEAELGRAIDFWESVGAARYLETATALRAKSA